jgi:hypothetical protein
MASHDIESDLGYVRDLVRKSDRKPTPAPVYLLWAVLVLVGFSLVDFAPQWVRYYWMVAAPLGGLASGWLARRISKNKGQVRRDIGVRHALHWGGMLMVVGLAVVLAVRGQIPEVELGRVILLLVAFGWWAAGVHFDRTFLLLGGMMMVGFVGTLIFPLYAWTTLGVLMAISLTIAAFRGGSQHASLAA